MESREHPFIWTRISSLTRWDSFTTGTGLRPIVERHSMRLAYGSLAPGGWHCRPSWNRRDYRRHGYGRGVLPSRRRISSRPEVTWSPGEFGRPKCWYRDVSDADKPAEAAWLRAKVMGPGQAVWALRITARDRYSDRCWAWGEKVVDPRA
jgi:hypothetical protein